MDFMVENKQVNVALSTITYTINGVVKTEAEALAQIVKEGRGLATINTLTALLTSLLTPPK